MKNAIKYFKSEKIFQIDPFVFDFVDTLPSSLDNILQLRLDYRGKSMEIILKEISNGSIPKTPDNLKQENLQIWANNNQNIIDKMSETEKKDKEIQENLKRVLREKT